MKFRHSLTVFIDNFAVTYKQLLYRLIITLIATAIGIAVIIPFLRGIFGSEDYASLIDGVKSFLINLVEGKPDALAHATAQIKEAFNAVINLVIAKKASIIWGIVIFILIRLVEQFFAGLGNYATAAVINDKMALRAKSPFFLTMIRNLKEASLYSLMYVPLSFLYDAICFVGFFFIAFRLLARLPLVYLPVQIFIFATLCVIAVAVKLTFTTDWLPSVIRGKKGAGQSFLYTFDRRRKNSFNVLSNFIILVIIIFAVNVAAIICTFGVAALITVPSSFVILLCFEFVNYYEREELRYFIDKKTIIKPEKEHTVTREEFFRGE